MTNFKRSDLPFNKNMKNFWNSNGYLVFENFYTNDECDVLINQYHHS